MLTSFLHLICVCVSKCFSLFQAVNMDDKRRHLVRLQEREPILIKTGNCSERGTTKKTGHSYRTEIFHQEKVNYHLDLMVKWVNNLWQSSGDEQSSGHAGQTLQLAGPRGLSKQPVGPSGETEQPAGPAGPTEQPESSAGQTEQPDGPSGPTKQPEGPYGPTEQPTGPAGQTEQPDGPAGQTEQPSGHTGTTDQPISSA